MAAPTADGYLHEVGFYASDDEFRALISPFVLDGAESGEPVVFAYDPRKMDMLQQWFPEAPGITYITDTGPYATPAKALASWRKVVESHLAAGAPRVRIAGNVPHPGYGRPYAGWDRYEAAVDRAMGDLPVWAPCLYDARIAPAEVLEAAGRLHHHVLDAAGGHRTNGSFDAVRRLADFLPPPADPLEESKPTVELVDPTPARARLAVRGLVEGLVTDDQREALVLAVSEAVTNALVHGKPPVAVRIWLGAGQVVVHVHDEGPGPADPLAGLLPSPHGGAGSGRGLWIAHLLDVDVALVVDDQGFTLRLRVERMQPSNS
jgi:anti-sigma regulatory factor (Ser/Thr protein kinase)